jgi:glutamine cyclotransferase
MASMATPSRRSRIGGAWMFIALTAGLVAACAKDAPPLAAPPLPAAEDLVVQVVRSYPHDRGAFTQGLLYHEGRLYESTGLPGRSSLRRVVLESGQVERQIAVPNPIFAEGLARVEDRLVQLTWQEQRAFVWSLDRFQKVAEHAYEGEGWGLCYDGQRLVMSDGSAHLTFRDGRTFERVGEVTVTRNGAPLPQLNELECVDGAVYANVWQTESIARIDPGTGRVTAWIDASGLLTDNERASTDVLNGIAYRPETKTFLLTGKLWPRLVEVQFVPRRPPSRS